MVSASAVLSGVPSSGAGLRIMLGRRLGCVILRRGRVGTGRVCRRCDRRRAVVLIRCRRHVLPSSGLGDRRWARSESGAGNRISDVAAVPLSASTAAATSSSPPRSRQPAVGVGIGIIRLDSVGPRSASRVLPEQAQPSPRPAGRHRYRRRECRPVPAALRPSRRALAHAGADPAASAASDAASSPGVTPSAALSAVRSAMSTDCPDVPSCSAPPVRNTPSRTPTTTTAAPAGRPRCESSRAAAAQQPRDE